MINTLQVSHFHTISAPFPPTDVTGFCDVVVWSVLEQPGGEIFGYEIRLFIPDTQNEVTINLGRNPFYILGDSIKQTMLPTTLIQVQV